MHHYITVTFKFRPGGLDEFMTLFVPLLPFIRSLEGVLFFEMARRADEADCAVASEGFVDEAVHAAMWQTPQFKEVGQWLDRLVIGRRIYIHSGGAPETVLGGTPPRL
jgi:quinol monooxygenase YgiN